MTSAHVEAFPVPQMLDASNFEVDLRYQRKPEDRLSDLKKIAENFHPGEFGVLHVTERKSGETVFIDGAGRGHVYYKILGRTGKVLCIKHPEMALSKEAQLFVRLNRNRRAVNSGDMFKADVAAKDKEAVAIQLIFDKLGMTIGRASGPHNTASVQSAKILYRHDPDTLMRALVLKKAVWPEEVCGGGLLEAIGLFLRAVPGLDEVGFRKVLHSHPPGVTLEFLRNFRGSGRMPLKRYIPQFAAELWADKYNHKRKKSRADLNRITRLATTKPDSENDD